MTTTEAPSHTEPATPGATDERWFGSGRGDHPDAGEAARAALAAAAAGRTPSLVIALCSPGLDLEAMLRGLTGAAGPDCVVAGCTTNGHYSLPGTGPDPAGPGAPVDVDAGVAVLALGGEGFSVSAGFQTEVSADRRAAGARAALVVDDLDAPHRTCLLLADGLTGDQSEIVRGAYGHLGALVPIVGGLSGDGQAWERTHQFLAVGDRVEVDSDSLVSIGLGSTGRVGIGIDHGWTKTGHPMIVSRSEDGRILELDDRPALEVYLERLGLDRGVTRDEVLLREITQRFPLGLTRRAGEDMRLIYGADVAEGSLLCQVEVPQGAIAWEMTTEKRDLISAARLAYDRAVEALDGVPPIGLMAFDCVARRARLGRDGVDDELAELARINRAPMTGYYTSGEIARTAGARGMHQLTFVCVALS